MVPAEPSWIARSAEIMVSTSSPSTITRLPKTFFIVPRKFLLVLTSSKNSGSALKRSRDSPPVRPASDARRLNSFRSSKFSRCEKKISILASSRTTISFPDWSDSIDSNSLMKLSISLSLSILLNTNSSFSGSFLNLDAVAEISAARSLFSSKIK